MTAIWARNKGSSGILGGLDLIFNFSTCENRVNFSQCEKRAQNFKNVKFTQILNLSDNFWSQFF